MQRDMHEQDYYPQGGKPKGKNKVNLPDFGKGWRKFKNGFNIFTFLVLFSMGLLVGIDLLTPAHVVSNLQLMLGGYSTWAALFALFCAAARAGHVITQILNSKAGRVIAFVVFAIALWSALQPHSFWMAWNSIQGAFFWVVDGAFMFFDFVAGFFVATA